MPAPELFDPVPKKDFVKALFNTIAQWNEACDWQGDERNVVLTLARIRFSVSTGKISSKDAAALWALERLPDEYRDRSWRSHRPLTWAMRKTTWPIVRTR